MGMDSFVSFVNNELPKRISTNSDPTQTAKDQLFVTTGIGLSTTPKTIAEVFSIYHDDPNTGENGKSAYQIAVEHGFTGTETEWLASLQGPPGQSAYELAVEAGYSGTFNQWLESLKGEPGQDGANGADGRSAYELAVEAGFTGTKTQWLNSLKGQDGTDGINGKTAYQIAVEHGFTGTEQEWIQKLEEGFDDVNEEGFYLRQLGEWVRVNAYKDPDGRLVFDGGTLGGT